MAIKFTKLLTAIIVSILGVSITFTCLPAFAGTDIDACNSLNAGSLAYKAAGCSGTSDQLPLTIINILNVVIGISSIIAIVFIVIGGINYMTSSGDAAKVKKAKDTILYACIGLAVCALSFAIANWAITTVNNSSSTGSSSDSSNNSENSN